MPSILLDGPAVEPVSLAEAKAYLRVEHTADDDTIAALIAGARIHVEAQTHRALITQTWRIARDAWPGNGRIAVVPVPLRALVAARIYKLDGSTQAIDLDGFAVDKISAPAVLAFAAGALPAPGRVVGGIEIDIAVGLRRRARRCAGAAAPGGPRVGRALVREPRADRGRPHGGGAAGERERAAQALPGAVAMSDLSIDPGALNRRLTLEAPVETADGAGGVVRSLCQGRDAVGVGRAARGARRRGRGAARRDGHASHCHSLPRGHHDAASAPRRRARVPHRHHPRTWQAVSRYSGGGTGGLECGHVRGWLRVKTKFAALQMKSRCCIFHR